jgi:DNA polymerase
MEKYLLIDFETKCDLDLKKVGTKRYCAHPSFDVVCAAYKIIDENFDTVEATDIIYPEDGAFSLPLNVRSFKRIYAHNIFFDANVWIRCTGKYHWPAIPRNNLHDVMAICGRFSLPQSLDKVTEVLDVPIKKRGSGKRLMKKICSPPYKYTIDELQEFYLYCIQDVDAMHELLRALPATKLSDSEYQIWMQTLKMNERGVPVDAAAITAIHNYIEKYAKERAKAVAEITDGMVKTPNQLQKIKDFCLLHDCELPDVTKDTVESTLQQDNLHPKVKTLLELRQELGKSSLKKYQSLMDRMYMGCIHENLRYYGAQHTGRYAGMGFQLQNLPRGDIKPEDIEPTIEAFKNGDPIEDPLEAAKNLIRSMIKAPRNNYIFAADYSSIENVLAAWFVGDMASLKLFDKGEKQYVEMAKIIYGAEYDPEDKQQYLMGKITILGCGYGMGGKAFRKNAANYGVAITEKFAGEVVKAYRKKYNSIVRAWYRLKECAVNAVKNKGYQYTYRTCSFQCVLDRTGRLWLSMVIPSGRAIYYCEPQLERDAYGQTVSIMATDSYTRKWIRQRLIPGRIFENVIQGLARDILCHGQQQLQVPVLASVHDELIGLCGAKSGDELRAITTKICQLPKWAEGIPLKADGFIEKRYRKA